MEAEALLSTLIAFNVGALIYCLLEWLWLGRGK